jgi:hypothetical protein
MLKLRMPMDFSGEGAHDATAGFSDKHDARLPI